MSKKFGMYDFMLASSAEHVASQMDLHCLLMVLGINGLTLCILERGYLCLNGYFGIQ